MTSPFGMLFSPIKVGSLILRNRVVMQPTTNCYSDKTLATERQTVFYRARARGVLG